MSLKKNHIQPVHLLLSTLCLFIAFSVNGASEIAKKLTAKDNRKNQQFTYEGTEKCLSCHSAEKMQLMGKGPHGKKDNASTPYAQQGCESCHGPGSFHVSRAHGGRGFPKMVTFGKKASSSIKQQTTACLKCHGKKGAHIKPIQWPGSSHAVAGLSCSSCHQLHTEKRPLSSQKTQAEKCYSCHKKQRKLHPKFERKGIEFNKLNCFTCHDVHQLIHQADNKTAKNQTVK